MAEATRVLLFTHGDAVVTRAATAALAGALAARGVELVLPADEAAKHPDLPGATGERPDAVDLVLVLGGVAACFCVLVDEVLARATAKTF